MICCMCLISSFDSGGDVSRERGRWASLPYCLGSGEYGQCWGFGAIMLVFLQLLEDVARHGEIECAVMIIPFEAYTAIEISILIFGELIFFFDCPDEVVCVLLSRVFYPKIVNFLDCPDEVVYVLLSRVFYPKIVNNQGK